MKHVVGVETERSRMWAACSCGEWRTEPEPIPYSSRLRATRGSRLHALGAQHVDVARALEKLPDFPSHLSHTEET